MLTIRSLVADEALELRVLAAGRPGALDADVVWVHNTELLDPSPYLRQRELVLTNGLWHEGAESSATFVANVVRAGGAGIVFGLREQAPTTPPDLIAACRDAELPLLEISATVPFTAVSRAVATVYAERRQRALLRTVRRGDALAEAISVGSGAAGVLRVLRRDHDLPLAVVDRTGRLLGAEGVPLPGPHLDGPALPGGNHHALLVRGRHGSSANQGPRGCGDGGSPSVRRPRWEIPPKAPKGSAGPAGREPTDPAPSLDGTGRTDRRLASQSWFGQPRPVLALNSSRQAIHWRSVVRS
ncbi:PucR family transcriptional regulator ligand-binding domain-containing protein [Thermasporomyces composti]|uniref:Purine catabolism regulatory family protein n=1 Tax=Thermasporomyces composti TaxID=696763 RepID=A0A3D9V5V9_THECX|nr:PucR family transcriptional regulator ligand-binding domain-containing protein [Thermasporomyces composti]REF36083.1 purine catabolism regulatory family protein [Thermasporomyces composti]